MQVRLAAENGYQFAKKVYWTLDNINMTAAGQSAESGGITLSYEYTVPTIRLVTIGLPQNSMGIYNLLEGDNAPYTAVLGDASYQLSTKKDDDQRHNGIQYKSSNGWYTYDYSGGNWKLYSGSGYMIDYILEPTGSNIFPGDEFLKDSFLVSTDGISSEIVSCNEKELHVRVVYPVWSKITDMTFSIGKNLQAD